LIGRTGSKYCDFVARELRGAVAVALGNGGDASTPVVDGASAVSGTFASGEAISAGDGSARVSLGNGKATGSLVDDVSFEEGEREVDFFAAGLFFLRALGVGVGVGVDLGPVKSRLIFEPNESSPSVVPRA
jgi:hypothetical protein